MRKHRKLWTPARQRVALKRTAKLVQIPTLRPLSSGSSRGHGVLRGRALQQEVGRRLPPRENKWVEKKKNHHKWTSEVKISVLLTEQVCFVTTKGRCSFMMMSPSALFCFSFAFTFRATHWCPQSWSTRHRLLKKPAV